MPLTIEWGVFPFTSFVTRSQPAYIDANGYIWDAVGLVSSGSTAGAWWGNYGVYDTTSSGGTVFTQYGTPIYQDNGQPYPYSAGCHLAFIIVPVVPRLTFGYYDGTTWRFATIKDTGVTGDPLPTVSAGTNPYLHSNPSCTNGWNGPGLGSDRAFVSPTNPGVVWDITPPSVSFTQPFHPEYR
jgi:hypothetical protein